MAISFSTARRVFRRLTFTHGRDKNAAGQGRPRFIELVRALRKLNERFPKPSQLGPRTEKPQDPIAVGLGIFRIGVLFGCFGRKTDGPGLPGGLLNHLPPNATPMIFRL